MLPWPPQWPKPQRVKYVLTVAFLGVFGCVGVAAGVSIFRPGFTDNRAYLLALAPPLLFGASAIVILTRLRLRGRSTTAVRIGSTDDTGERGLVIPYSHALAATYVLVCATTLALFVVIAVVTLLALAAPGPTDMSLVAQAAICLAFVAYLAWTLIEATRRRLTAGAVILTPSGVYHRSWAFDSYLPWDQAVSVSAGQPGGQWITLAAYGNAHPRIQRRSLLWKQPEYKLAPHTAIQGMYLAIDPGLAFHSLRFYHTNPAARAELGTDAAVRRVRNGAVLSP